MPTPLEISERQRYHLGALLKLKKDNEGSNVKGLQELIIMAITGMDEKDVALVEKLYGVKSV